MGQHQTEASTSPRGAPRPTQSSMRPTQFDDYLCYSARPNDLIIDSSVATPPQHRFSGTRYPIVNYVSFEKFTSSHNNFLAALKEIMEPKHF